MVSTERRSNWHHSLRTGDTMLEASKEQEAEWTPPAPFLIQWYNSCGGGGVAAGGGCCLRGWVEEEEVSVGASRVL